MRTYLPLILAAVIVLGGLYHAFLYPPTVLKRHAEEAVQQFNDAIASKDKAKMDAAIDAFMTDDAHIKLTVEFIAITQAIKPMSQDFDKATFKTFADNEAYSMSDFSQVFRLENFKLSGDHATAEADLPSAGWGDSTSSNYYAGTTIKVRYNDEAHCAVQMRFENKVPRLAGAVCSMQVGVAPLAGANDALKSADELRNMLKQ